MLKNFKTQQKLAHNLLMDMKNNFDPSAVIAGGAPRNWDHNILANDIDIFMNESYLEKFQKDTKLSLVDNNRYSGKIESLDVDVTFVNRNPIKVIDYFTPSISQIYYDGVNTIKSELKESLDEKMCIAVNGQDDYNRKIVNRFASDYKIIFPYTTPYFIIETEVWHWPQGDKATLIASNISENDAKDLIHSLRRK